MYTSRNNGEGPSTLKIPQEFEQLMTRESETYWKWKAQRFLFSAIISDLIVSWIPFSFILSIVILILIHSNTNTNRCKLNRPLSVTSSWTCLNFSVKFYLNLSVLPLFLLELDSRLFLAELCVSNTIGVGEQ